MTAAPAWRLPWRDRAFGSLFRRLRRIGVDVTPFLVVREPVQAEGSHPIPDGLTAGFVGPDATDELMRLEPTADRDEVERSFADGKLCFALWEGDRMLAKMWCDLDECNFAPNRRPLEDDEAYLYWAYSDPAHRGRRLAPVMRAAAYDALRERGRTRFWSYTDYFNPSARAFKRTLGARDELLRVHVEVRRRWSRTVTLWRYR